jgi:hypothetical protein
MLVEIATVGAVGTNLGENNDRVAHPGVLYEVVDLELGKV